jgi:hypothetical protein
MRRTVLCVVAVVAYMTLSFVLGSCYVIAQAIKDRPAEHQSR